MSIRFSKALLMSGEDYQLSDYITLHHPVVKEILSIDNSPVPDNFYLTYVQVLLSDPYTNMVMLDDMGKNYLEVSPYDVFCIQWDNCTRIYQENKSAYDVCGINSLDTILKSLNFFIAGDHDFVKSNYKNGEIFFYDTKNPTCQINKEVFGYLHEWVKSINKIDYSGRINPADENARRILIEDKRDELKKAKRRRNKSNDTPSDFLGNMMSANCFCGTINPFNLKECKIYWLNEAFSITNRKSNVDHLIDGIYHGTINSKDISKKDLDWAK